MRSASPLRYPGGKWRISGFLERVINLNHLNKPTYVEPYAGGASLALSLLFQDLVSEVHLNDLDPAIYSFWYSILEHNKDFCRLVSEVPITIDEWKKQRRIYQIGISAGKLALGFATFFLNRTNHSGILNGGIIGGKNQCGEWKADARFNRAELRTRIERIGIYKSQIRLSCEDAIKFLKRRNYSSQILIYLDPPYYRPGRHLYLNTYKLSDHSSVSKFVLALRSRWIVSYDDVPPIRILYKSVRSRRINLLHTARCAHMGKEVLFFAPGIRIPLTT